MREHIDVALEERGLTPVADDVEDVLRQLGSVEHIARNADDHGSTCPHEDARNRSDADGDRSAAAAQYLLAALIVGMAVTASLVTVRIPPFFSPEGGDPVAVAQLTWALLVFAVAARLVKRNA